MLHVMVSSLSANSNCPLKFPSWRGRAATASPSAIGGCADKVKFSKVLYVPIGGPAHRCVGEVWVCCCCHGFMFVATSEAWLSARLSAVTLGPAGGPS